LKLKQVFETFRFWNKLILLFQINSTQSYSIITSFITTVNIWKFESVGDLQRASEPYSKQNWTVESVSGCDIVASFDDEKTKNFIIIVRVGSYRVFLQRDANGRWYNNSDWEKQIASLNSREWRKVHLRCCP